MKRELKDLSRNHVGQDAEFHVAHDVVITQSVYIFSIIRVTRGHPLVETFFTSLTLNLIKRFSPFI